MTISIDWPNTKVISVPQADLIMLSATEYELDVDAFHIILRDLEAAVTGAPWATTHIHNTEVTIGGVVFARQVIIIGGYTVTFEDVGPPYAVTLTGANNNILDVANLNSVSIRPSNSAGLITTPQIREVWKLMGLDIDNPMTVTPNSRAAGPGVAQTISGDGVDSTTITRDP